MAAYVRLLIQTCHRRGVHAMGGMSAFIPIKDDSAANQKVTNWLVILLKFHPFSPFPQVLDKVRADKLRECEAGHDGTWVAHPGLIAVAKQALFRAFDFLYMCSISVLDGKQVFDQGMPTPNQLHVRREEVSVTASDLLDMGERSAPTAAGLASNIDVSIR